MAVALADILKASVRDRKKGEGTGPLLQDDSEDDSDLEDEPEMEVWVNIQRSTFTNWVGDKLSSVELQAKDIRKDFRSGIKLCRLAEVLTGNKIGKIVGLKKKKVNHYEASGNLQLALDAFKKDNVRLVNIGAEDIRSANLKLILGMVWSLIRRYQLGSSRLPPKTLMLSWMNAVLHPHLTISNFSTDLNDGKALHGILEFCKPGLAPDWYLLNPHNEIENCRSGMNLAQQEFGIPEVLSPENFASGDLDELSGMTYFSYFMSKESPGYEATLAWVRGTVHPTQVDDFTTSWNDGQVASSLAHALGGHVPGYPDIGNDAKKACSNAIHVSSEALGVPTIMTGGDMSNPAIDHIALMAYAAWHRALVPSFAATPGLSLLHNALVPKTNGASDRVPSPPPPPSPPSPPPAPLVPLPPEPPKFIEPSNPENERVVYPRNCSINNSATIKVDTREFDENKTVEATSHSPTGQNSSLQVERVDTYIHHVIFKPSQSGRWSIAVEVGGSAIRGSPFHIDVYDSTLAQIIRDENETLTPDSPYSFQVDVSRVGLSDIDASVTCQGRLVPTKVRGQGSTQYEVTFTPQKPKQHDVSVYVGGNEIPGSPFSLEVGDGQVRFSEEPAVFNNNEEEVKEAKGEVRGDGIYGASVGKKAHFTVNPAEDGDVHCSISDPKGGSLEVDIETKGSSIYCTYFPELKGVHKIEVMCAGRHFRGSPFKVDVTPDLIVRGMPNRAVVKKDLTFFVDASQMPKGSLEIDSDMRLEKYDPVPGRKKCFNVTCVPEKTGLYNIILRFNKQAMADSPYEVDVVRK